MIESTTTASKTVKKNEAVKSPTLTQPSKLQKQSQTSSSQNIQPTTGDVPTLNPVIESKSQRMVNHESTAEDSPVSVVSSAPAASSKQWQLVARDPLVQQVKEAVEGTLMGVRPVQKPVTSEPLEESIDGIREEALE